MELYERLDLDRINYLNKLSFEEFKRVCSRACKNEAERKAKYNMLKRFCEANIKAKGEVRRLYAYTDKTPVEVGGRLYSGNSIQGLSRKIRGFLCKNLTDVDMKSAHPTIIRWLCRKHKIDTPMLNYYIENREQICERFGPDGKMVFLSALNDERLNKKIKDDIFVKFDKECKMIQTKILALDEYKHIVASTPMEKLWNYHGSAFNRIMCVYENRILQEVISVLNQKHIEIMVLMFDGLMIKGNYYADEKLLREIEERVNRVFEGLDMKFSYKEHDDEIVIPENYEAYDEERSNEDGYEYVKAEFEKTHAKITEKSLYIIIKKDDLLMMPMPKLRDAYMEMKYMDYSKDKPEKKQFISRWLLDETIRKYVDFGVYPPPLKCPPYEYNLWRPFKVSTYTDEYEKDEEGLNMFKEHISILCNHDKAVAHYFIQWLGQMFQYPAVKTIVPTLISKEGAGKGRLMELLELLIGGKKSRVIEVTQPSRDCWGTFNSIMLNAFFVNLNEMCKKEAQMAENVFKGLVTDGTLMISRKGIDPYPITSFHRFLITTNNDEPMKVKTGDRRHNIIRSSDEKASEGKSEAEKIEIGKYFDKLMAHYNSVRTQRTIYDYLMSLPDLDKFVRIARPETEWSKDNKKLNESLEVQWVEAMVRANCDVTEQRYAGGEQYDAFNKWCKSQGHQNYETNAIKLAIAIKRLNLPGVETAVPHGNQTKTVYHIYTLKQHFKIGCLISLTEN